MRVLVLLALFAYECCVVEAIRAPGSPGKKTAPVVLLHQSAATSSKVSTAAQAADTPLWKHGRPINPQPHGHMLTDTELQPIENIACLEAKQHDPTVNCSDILRLGSGPLEQRPLNAGNYPMWKETRCNSNGEYFCDPDRLLSAKERKTLTDQMKKLREGHQITCGPQLQHDPVDKWHYEPFYLGVAIAKDWPQHESDAQSLQSFGRLLAGRWNMTFPWDGNPAFYARCPNEAMLIILPEKRQAHLSSPSCMFICQEKGGPEVAIAARLGLDSKGLMAGVSAGMAEVYKAIAVSSPMHEPGWEPVEKTSGTWETWNKAPEASGKSHPSSMDESLWNWGQRILFGVAVILLAGSLIVALLVCYLAPGLAKELNKPGARV